ncbi:hypothetical protein BC830DRAFT_339814 [Chytriomyces sp. MP71]|nr:hypothetical protein BC830DRAFT_339814 [Chytriomyces sp. MP71]
MGAPLPPSGIPFTFDPNRLAIFGCPACGAGALLALLAGALVGFALQTAHPRLDARDRIPSASVIIIFSNTCKMCPDMTNHLTEDCNKLKNYMNMKDQFQKVQDPFPDMNMPRYFAEWTTSSCVPPKVNPRSLALGPNKTLVLCGAQVKPLLLLHSQLASSNSCMCW